MSSQISARVAESVAWSKLHTDYQLLETTLGLLRSERLQTSCEEGRPLDVRDKPSPIEQQVQETIADTTELLRALDDGHIVAETWRPELHSSHVKEIQALGTVLVNTFAERIQQVRYRTNDLVFKCARMYIWHQCANTDQLATYRFLSRWEQLDEQVRFIEGQSSSRALTRSSFVGHGDRGLVRRDLEVLEQEWVNRLGSIPDFVRASLTKLNGLPEHQDSGRDRRDLRMVKRASGGSMYSGLSERDLRMVRRASGGSLLCGLGERDLRMVRHASGTRRDSALDMGERRMSRRTADGELARRPQEVRDDESESESDGRSRRRRDDGRGRSPPLETRQERQRGPLEHFLRETGAGLGATVGRGLDTIVREGKEEVQAFFVGHRRQD